MSPVGYIILGVQALIFAYWIYVMFRTLMLLTGVATQRRTDSGRGVFEGMDVTIKVYFDFAVGRIDRPRRNHLILVTVIMMASIALFTLTQV